MSFGVQDAVGTAGSWQISPNAVNSVPRKASLQLDMRDIDEARRDEVLQHVIAAAKAIAERRKVRIHSLHRVGTDKNS